MDTKYVIKGKTDLEHLWNYVGIVSSRCSGQAASAAKVVTSAPAAPCLPTIRYETRAPLKSVHRSQSSLLLSSLVCSLCPNKPLALTQLCMARSPCGIPWQGSVKVPTSPRLMLSLLRSPGVHVPEFLSCVYPEGKLLGYRVETY